MATTRPNVLSLSGADRSKFVSGLLAMKKNGTYNKYIRNHALATGWTSRTGSVLNMAHVGPAFAPWHRKFLQDFERDLQSAIGTSAFGLPYYDWTDGSGAKSAVWGTDLMGGQGNPITSGPFVPAAWATIDENGQPTSGLIRQFGSSASPPLSLPSRTDVHRLFYRPVYDAVPWTDQSNSGLRNALEGFFPRGLHNLVHAWVGGQMSRVPVAPNDPVFFLHHCNVDRIWAQWQLTYPAAGYLPVSGAAYGHNLNDPMYPWNTGAALVRPADMLSISNLGYKYDAYYNIGTLQVVITTGSSTFSGTDNDVDFVISGTPQGPFWSTTLDASHCDHSDPFEQGQTDTFTYKNVSNLSASGIPPLTPAVLTQFSLGKMPDDSWFGTGDWVVQGIKIIADGLVLYNNQNLKKTLNNSQQHIDDGNGNKLIPNP